MGQVNDKVMIGAFDQRLMKKCAFNQPNNPDSLCSPLSFFNAKCRDTFQQVCYVAQCRAMSFYWKSLLPRVNLSFFFIFLPSVLSSNIFHVYFFKPIFGCSLLIYATIFVFCRSRQLIFRMLHQQYSRRFCFSTEMVISNIH